MVGRGRERRARRRAGADAAHLARPARRRPHARLDRRWPTGCCELDFEIPLAGGERPTARGGRSPRWPTCCGATSPAADPMRAYADRLVSPALGGQELRGYLSGSIDVVLRVGEGDDQRFVVVDYKTNRLGEVDQPLTARDYTPAAMTAAMLHSHYPLQALLYSVVAAPLPALAAAAAYDPERHLGGILYLYVRGMCGPETPEVDGVPCGVFTWRPPAAMVRRALRPARRHAGRGGCVVTADRTCGPTRYDRRRALARAGAARHVQPARPAGRRRRPRRPADGGAARGGRRAGAPRRRARRAGGAPGLGLPRPGHRRRPARSSRDDHDPLPWPDVAAVGGAGRPQPAGARGDAAPGRHPPLPRPLLARGGPGLRRPGRPDPAYPPATRPTSTRRRCGPVSSGSSPATASPSSATPREAAATSWTTVITGGPGTGKTTTVAGLLALVAEQHELATGRPPRIALAAPTGKAAARLQEAVQDSVHADNDALSDPADQARLAGLRSSTLHRLLGLAPRQPGPVPAPPRQPAALRRGRGRRDLDGLADDDGPAARGRAPGHPARAGRRPRPARLGRGRRRAGRHRGRLRGRRRLAGDAAAHHPPLRRAHRRAGPGAARPTAPRT